MPFSIVSPVIEEKQEFSWRSIRRTDLLDIWNLLQIVNRVDDNDYAETLADLDREYDDPQSDPVLDGRVIRNVFGKLAAFLRVFVSTKPENENVAFLWSVIAPQARDQGLEQEALDWMQDRATERLAETAQSADASALPQLLRAAFPETATETIALYEANGFKHVRSFFKMQRDLREPIPDHPLPKGLTLRTYGDDIDGPLRRAFNESFRDHWGHQDVSEQEWRSFVMDVSDMRRDLCLVAMDGDEVVAFSLNRIKTIENKRLKLRRGWIGSVGTRRKWRKRGIASALIVESMRRFKAVGMDYVGLGVDASSLTGALALYERLGFQDYKTRVILEKRVG